MIESQRGVRTMEKLKIYGRKPGFKGFIADIYVQNGKLIVESEDPQVKQDLEKALKEATLDEEFTIGARAGGERETEDGSIAYYTYIERLKPGDDGYLLTLRARPVFGSDSLDDWKAGKGRKIGDYEMDTSLSRIIDDSKMSQAEIKLLEEKVRKLDEEIEKEKEEKINQDN